MEDFSYEFVYSLTKHLYNSTDCLFQVNSTQENGLCAIDQSIEKCCDKVANTKNISLNICNYGVMWTCDLSEQSIETLGFFGTMLVIISFASFILGLSLICCCVVNYGRKHFHRIGYKNLDHSELVQFKGDV